MYLKCTVKWAVIVKRAHKILTPLSVSLTPFFLINIFILVVLHDSLLLSFFDWSLLLLFIFLYKRNGTSTTMS